MKLIKIFILVLTLSSIGCEKKDANASNYEDSKKEIAAMLNGTAKDWSNGDVEAFMEGYIKSDSLKFIGSQGLTYGWQQTLDNYKKGYPTKEHMGTLTFDLIEFDQLATDVFFVIGKYNLKRTVGDASGHFSLILKKIEGKWKIVADHSS